MDLSKGIEQEQAQRPGQGLESSSAADVQRQEDRDRRGWASLDEGLLPLVASKLQKNEQRNLGPARLACRQWAAEFSLGCSRLEVNGKGPAGWEKRFCGLQELTWLYPENTGKPWPKLKSLRLERFRDGDLQILKNLPSLASLDLASFSLTDVGLKELSDLPTLTCLSLSGCCNITDTGLKELNGYMSPLTSLNLRGCDKITNAGLKELGHLSSLTSLDLSRCSNITNGGIKELRHMPALTSLNFHSCYNITDAGLKELGQIAPLASLKLSGCYHITDVGLKELKYMPSLTDLNLTACYGITDKGLKELEGMSALTSLNLTGCSRITDAGLKELVRRLPCLASLDLSYCCNITG